MELVYDRDTNVRCIPFKDSPADRAGIEYQDILREVNGQQIQGLSLEDLAALIRGKAGSSVKLLVEKYDGWRESYTIKRSNQSYADLIKSDQTPETIKISRFSKGVAQALKAELLKLKTPPHKRIFLDLRGNTGGYLEEGAACAALFLNKGETLYTYQSKTGTTVHKTTEDGPECARKLIILMDELTASSAELLITALKQRQEVGTYGYPTAGKSLIQEVFNLKNGAVLKLSVGELLYAGKPYGWQDEGLKPDVEQH